MEDECWKMINMQRGCKNIKLQMMEAVSIIMRLSYSKTLHHGLMDPFN